MKRKQLAAVLTLVVVFAAIAVAVCQPSGEALTEDQRSLLEQAQERADRLDTLYLTARGLGLSGDGWASDDTLQSRVDQDVADRLLAPSDGRVCIKVEVDEGAPQRACMDYESAHEGKLFRFHVDRPDRAEIEALDRAEAECNIEAIVIGFYSHLWGGSAVNDQRYQCIPCGSIWVCGSSPSCD